MPKNIGIRLCKRPDSEYWQYYIRYKGVTHRGSTNEKDKRKAEDRAYHIQYDLTKQAGIDQAGNISIDVCVDRYLEHMSDFRKETIKTYKAYIKNLVGFLRKRYPHIKLMKEVTPDTIESFKAYKLEHSSRTTVHNQIKGFKALFNWAKERGLITESPMDKVRNLSKKQIRETQKPVEILTLEDMGKFVEYTKKHYPELYPLYMVWMYTGARKNELYTLGWKDIDFENKLIKIRYKEDFIPKTDERTLPLHNKLVKILKAIPKKGKYVFMDGNKPFMYPDKTKSKGVYESHKPYRYLAKIMKAIGKPNFTRIHWLRHSYATIIAKEKGIKFAQEVLGHTDIRVTMRYIHLDRDYLQENLNKIEALDKIFK